MYKVAVSNSVRACANSTAFIVTIIIYFFFRKLFLKNLLLKCDIVEKQCLKFIMMTGHIEMDTPNKSNTVSACNSSIELSGNEFNGETNVATLDVTSEEINCNSKTWPSLVFADHSPKQARAGLGERQRSETWTYGLSNKQIKPIENDLNNKKVDDESNAQRHSFSPNTQQKTETARNKHLLSIPKKAEKGGNVKFSSENDNSFLSNQAKVSTVPNGCEASLSEDEAFSEFTDINLSRSCISPVPEQVRQDDEEKIAVGSASPTFRRQTMGSIFDWLVVTKSNYHISSISKL